AAVLFQRAEVERQVRHRCRQDAAGGAAGQIALEAVPLLHAAAILIDQLARAHARRREHDARFLDPPRHREAAQALALAPPVRGKPLRALLHDVAHPVERLDVLLERRATEQADLGHVRRAMPGQAALALDRLDHRGFFTADVRAGAAAQMHARVLGYSRALDL